MPRPVLVSLSLLALVASGCAGGGTGVPRVITAEESWCDKKVTEIDGARANVVRAYDSGDRRALRTRLRQMNRLCAQLEDARMLGESCRYHMYSGGRPTSPTRYNEASRVCLEARQMPRGGG